MQKNRLNFLSRFSSYNAEYLCKSKHHFSLSNASFSCLMILPIKPITMPLTPNANSMSMMGESAKVKYAVTFSHVVIDVPIIKSPVAQRWLVYLVHHFRLPLVYLTQGKVSPVALLHQYLSLQLILVHVMRLAF